jgi:hypothetical protein
VSKAYKISANVVQKNRVGRLEINLKKKISLHYLVTPKVVGEGGRGLKMAEKRSAETVSRPLKDTNRKHHKMITIKPFLYIIVTSFTCMVAQHLEIAV